LVSEKRAGCIIANSYSICTGQRAAATEAGSRGSLSSKATSSLSR